MGPVSLRVGIELRIWKLTARRALTITLSATRSLTAQTVRMKKAAEESSIVNILGNEKDKLLITLPF